MCRPLLIRLPYSHLSTCRLPVFQAAFDTEFESSPWALVEGRDDQPMGSSASESGCEEAIEATFERPSLRCGRATVSAEPSFQLTFQFSS